jgi:uncharacterized protein
MRILISAIPREGMETESEFKAALKEGGPEETVKVKMNVIRFGDRVMVEGHAEMTATLSCSRCLNEYTHPIEADFREEYFPASEMSAGRDHKLSADEMDVGYYSDDQIDVKDIAMEQMLLVVPIKQLCKPECKGLCPECGKDLNAGSCGCERADVDPRLSKLSELKERLKK